MQYVLMGGVGVELDVQGVVDFFVLCGVFVEQFGGVEFELGFDVFFFDLLCDFFYQFYGVWMQFVIGFVQEEWDWYVLVVLV